MSTYLWIDLLSIAIPLIFSFTRWFPFYKEWPDFWPAVILTAIIFLLWDIKFTAMGIWGFNPMHLCGVDLFGLPIEEYLFFICIPYACVFTYFVFRSHLPRLNLYSRPILGLLALLLLLLGIWHYHQWYTMTTFIALSIWLGCLLYHRVDYLDHFLLMYLMTLLPFFIVNGLLTGSWIEEEVVWYNDAENFGFRLGTIPVEDLMYGMLMLLMTVSGMEWLKGRRQSQ